MPLPNQHVTDYPYRSCLLVNHKTETKRYIYGRSHDIDPLYAKYARHNACEARDAKGSMTADGAARRARRKGSHLLCLPTADHAHYTVYIQHIHPKEAR